jgi:hypothetical protein
MAKKRRLNRRGRPRASGERHHCGKLKQPRAFNIPPTPEFEAKRNALAGDGDPRDCGDPLGVLFARNKITRGQRDAGLTYNSLYRAWNGNGIHATCVSIEARGGGGGRELSASAKRRIDRKYRKAKRILLQCGRSVASAVEAAAVFEEYGVVFDEARAETVRVGLSRLRRHFVYGR